MLVVDDAQNGFHNEASARAIRRIVPLVRKVQHAPDTDVVADLTPYIPRALAVADNTGYSVFTAG